MVIEDEPGVRELTKILLERLGYQVFSAASGQEAIQQVEEGFFRPDLLITDVVMPGMGGAQLAEKLKEKVPGLKVLFMSGHTDETIIRHGMHEGKVPFIHKPFTMGRLAAKVREVLEES